MGRSDQNTGFFCAHCGRKVRSLTNGSYRNHCPFCLWSRHVDRTPGDRAHPCRGLMEPVAVERTSRGWRIIHRCRACDARRPNRIAERTDQPDDLDCVIDLPVVAV